MWEGPISILRNAIAVFGESCVYSPSSGDPIQFQAIFRKQASELDPVTGMKLMVERPQIRLEAALFGEGPRRGELITVRQVTYAIESFKPDGEGGALVTLKRVS